MTAGPNDQTASRGRLAPIVDWRFSFRGPNGFRTDAERTPNGCRTHPERTPNGPRTDLVRTPYAPRTDLERTPNRPRADLRTDPERTPNGPRINPERTPNGARTDPGRSQSTPRLHMIGNGEWSCLQIANCLAGNNTVFCFVCLDSFFTQLTSSKKMQCLFLRQTPERNSDGN